MCLCPPCILFTGWLSRLPALIISSNLSQSKPKSSFFSEVPGGRGQWTDQAGQMTKTSKRPDNTERNVLRVHMLVAQQEFPSMEIGLTTTR